MTDPDSLGSGYNSTQLWNTLPAGSAAQAGAAIRDDDASRESYGSDSGSASTTSWYVPPAADTSYGSSTAYASAPAISEQGPQSGYTGPVRRKPRDTFTVGDFVRGTFMIALIVGIVQGVVDRGRLSGNAMASAETGFRDVSQVCNNFESAWCPVIVAPWAASAGFGGLLGNAGRSIFIAVTQGAASGERTARASPGPGVARTNDKFDSRGSDGAVTHWPAGASVRVLSCSEQLCVIEAQNQAGVTLSTRVNRKVLDF